LGKSFASSRFVVPQTCVTKLELANELGSRWKNVHCESFTVRLRAELLNGEIFYSLRDTQITIKSWKNHFNTKRPRSALCCCPPAEKAIMSMDQRPIMNNFQIGPLKWGCSPLLWRRKNLSLI
jgi:hypothetical protein